MAYPPWIAMFSTIVVVVGLCIFTPNGISGSHRLTDAMETLGISLKRNVEEFPRELIIVTTIVAAALVAVLLLLSVFRSIMEHKRDVQGFSSGGQTYMVLNSVFNFLFWLTIIYLLIAFAVLVTAAAASFLLKEGASATLNLLEDKLADVKKSIQAAEDFVVKYSDSPQLRTDPELNAKVKALKALVGNVNGTESKCPYYCLDLTKLDFIDGNRCICGELKLQQAKDLIKKAFDHFVPAVIGMLVTFIGSTWLLMNMVGQFSHTKADRKWSRKINHLHTKNLAPQYMQA